MSKLPLIFGLVILSNYVGDAVAGIQNKIKITNIKAKYINSAYIDVKNIELKVIKVNETYNRFYVKDTVLKKLPLDTRTDVQVSRSRSCNGPWEKFGQYTSHICDKNDKNRKFLSNLFIVQTEEGKCVEKGTYKFDDVDTFQYFNSMPEDKLRGYYVMKKTHLGNNDIDLATYMFFYQSVELPPCPK